ncbi:MAG: hypothetical protein J0M04_10830 [Verrucomicrobia bacterium]|nr:hypothetical protein [Verrucomicrobiota bacterium]
MKASDTSDGITMDVEVSKSNILTIRITNNRRNSVYVDKEIVFMLDVSPYDFDRKYILENKSILPQIGDNAAAARFVEMKPNSNITRKIDLNKPFKVFKWAKSIPSSAISSYEALCAVKEPGRVVDVWIEYGGGFSWSALRNYLEDTVPAELLDAQLSCKVTMNQHANQ